MAGFSETKKCDYCRETKNWRLFVMGLENASQKQKTECRDCYRKRILPPKDKPQKKRTRAELLAEIFGDVTE